MKRYGLVDAQGNIDNSINMLLEVQNNITESGAINTFVSRIKTLILNGDRVGIVCEEQPDYILNMETCECITLCGKAKLNGAVNISRYEFNSERYSDRTVIHYRGADGKMMQSSLSIYRLTGIVDDIIKNGGETRETYIGLEVNHKVPRIFKEINNINNLELCNQVQNLRHFAAWSKIESIRPSKEFFNLELSALDEVVDFILKKDTYVSMYNFNEGYIALENESTKEYAIFTNVNGVYKHQGATGLEIDSEYRRI